MLLQSTRPAKYRAQNAACVDAPTRQYASAGRSASSRSRTVVVPRSSGCVLSSTIKSNAAISGRRCSHTVQVSASPAATENAVAQSSPRVLIAGAGIGGLVLAAALLKRGINVKVFERDMTAIRGEGKYRGPIQVQSNALAALEAIDVDLANEVLRLGCVTGDRINGLCDGVTGDWYIKFDTFHPAASRGLPVTRVISRVQLQEVLAKTCVKYAGPDVIEGNSEVIGFQEKVDSASGNTVVSVQLADGRVCEGDILVGADGIWSKIRKFLVGETRPNYSEYTCYTGISDFTPPDINVVGYRVFLGNGQYFVSSDVGGGKMQWYGFHKEPAGGADVDGMRKKRLLEIFGHWSDSVVDLIKATPEDDILRRDIYDRPPIFKWVQGHIALLGDSAHAMQPNLGQGGCMAIEDGYELAALLTQAVDKVANGKADKVNIPQVLRRYQDERLLRVSAIHGMAGMAANMASTYKAYLGEGLGPLSWITKYKIPHPGRVAGRVVMQLTMPSVLAWVLGGNSHKLAEVRAPRCLISDKPQDFQEDKFALYMQDDEALIRASNADWLLASERNMVAGTSGRIQGGSLITEKGLVVGSTVGVNGVTAEVTVEDIHVAPEHAKLYKQEEDYYVKDLGTVNGTWLNGRKLPAHEAVRLHPFDVVEFGRHPSHEPFRVKMQHVSLRDPSATQDQQDVEQGRALVAA